VGGVCSEKNAKRLLRYWETGYRIPEGKQGQGKQPAETRNEQPETENGNFAMNNTTQSYPGYLSSEAWERRQRSFISNVGSRCFRCCYPGEYVKHRHFRTLGNERVKDLEYLCGACMENDRIVKIENVPYTGTVKELDRLTFGQTQSLQIYFKRKDLAGMWGWPGDDAKKLRLYVRMMLGIRDTPDHGIPFDRILLGEGQVREREERREYNRKRDLEARWDARDRKRREKETRALNCPKRNPYQGKSKNRKG